MMLDHDVCYQAVRSRDPRFDGRFFTGVLTTGIYCRPVCPARTPRRENVRFFACAAAAEAAGLRPCLRCRPETAPGTPAWTGSAATVSRALRLIDDGFLDEAGVDDLAGALGVGSRHLRRLFDAHLGVPPRRVAQTRRLHFARRLLAETGLPVTEIAFSAGFSSVRRFNDAFRSTFGRAPSAMRRPDTPAGRGATLDLSLYRRPPYDARAVLDFLAARAVDGLESVDGAYRRTVSVGGASGVIAIRPDADRGVVMTVPAALARWLPALVARTRRVFDLDADPLMIASHLSRDSGLAPVLERNPGLPLPGAWDGFEMLVRALVGQQVSVAAARTILGRIVRRYGEPIEGSGPHSHLFPTPRGVAGARADSLRRCGLTAARARAVRDAARAVVDGRVGLDGAVASPEFAAQLCAIRGVGPWTAQMVALRALGDPDAFPAGDLGLVRGAERVLGIASARELEARSQQWRPWRAYAAAHLWNADNRKDSA